MPQTTNETTWAMIIVPLVITLGWGALLTWITIIAQHAKSIEEIKEYTKNIFVRLFLWASNLSAVSMLIWEYNSSLPINRKDVFMIVWSVALLFMSLILSVVTLLKEMSQLQKDHVDTTKLLSKNLGLTVDMISDISDNKDKQSKDNI